jgi:hypothetical protein
MEGIDRHGRLISDRDRDFAEALAALHELVGSTVSASVLGPQPGSGLAALFLRGVVARGTELGPGDSAPVAIEIAGVQLVVSPEALTRVCREE